MLKRALVANFRRLYAASHWLRRRFTMPGRVLLGTMLTAGALGIDTRQSLAYQGFALTGALLLLAMVAAPFLRVSMRLRRHLPNFATHGLPFTYRVELENLSTRPQADLVLVDELKTTAPSVAAFYATYRASERRYNWFDRTVGYPRWVTMMQESAGARIPEQPLPRLAPGESLQVTITITPLRRGYLRFERLGVARPEPLGLYRKLHLPSTTDSLLVLPRRYRVGPVELSGRRRHQPGGVALASHVGDSEEFISVRDYRPGDPPRHIHWKSWARTGRPIVKEFQAEFFVRHGLVLDTFSATGGERFEDAVSVAASYASAIPDQEALLDLMFVGADVYRLTSGRGVDASDHLLEVLACVQPCTDKDFSHLARAVKGQAAQLSGCICVLLAWDGPRQAFIQSLRALGVPLLVLVMTGPDENPAPGPMADFPEYFRSLRVGHLADDL